MPNFRRRFVAFFCTVAGILAVGHLHFAVPTSLALAQEPFDSKKIVPFVPSPQEVVDKMIELAAVKKGDVVFDMGSGDGRIVFAAAKKGGQAVGFESDGDVVKESRENIAKPACRNSRRYASRTF